MRFVVFGAGAIGGVVGGRLALHGHDVVLIARGAHHDAIRDSGLRIESPDGVETVPIPVVDTPSAIGFEPDDIVLLCVKSQDTAGALSALAASAPPDVPVVCVQNGVANERVVLRRFPNVYGVCVVCPAVHVEPGVVEANAAPIAGILDIGRFPHNADAEIDALADAVASALVASTFSSEARPDIMRWKYGKLLNNLSNAIDALCGREARGGDLNRLARAEGEACLDAAGIARVSREEDAERRGELFQWGSAAAMSRGGSSSWQSLARRPGLDRGRLPERRDRAARPSPRDPHTDQRSAPAAGEPSCPRRLGAGTLDARRGDPDVACPRMTPTGIHGAHSLTRLRRAVAGGASRSEPPCGRDHEHHDHRNREQHRDERHEPGHDVVGVGRQLPVGLIRDHEQRGPGEHQPDSCPARCRQASTGSTHAMYEART